MTTSAQSLGTWRRTAVQVGLRIGAGVVSFAAALAILYGSGRVALGVYAVSWTIAIIASLVVGNGFAIAVAWCIATGRATASEALRSAIPATALFASPIVVAAVVLMSLGVFADHVSWLGVAISVPLVLFAQSVFGVLQGEYRTDAHAVLSLPQPVALLWLSIAFWIATPPPDVAMWLVAVPATIQAIFALFLVGAFWKGTRQPGLRQMLVRYTRRIYLGSIASIIINRADLVLVSAILGPASAGTYGLALTLGEGTIRFAQGAATVLFAPAARQTVQATAIRETHRLALVSSVLTLAACLLTAAAAGAASLYDPGLAEVALLLLVLSFGISLLAAGMIYASYFTARGFPELPTQAALIVAPLCLIGYAAVIPAFGLVGAALGSSLAYGAIGVLSWAFVRRTVERDTPSNRFIEPRQRSP